MSPLKGILVAGLRRASHRAARPAALCTACLLLFVAAARTAKAADEADAIRDGDARRAEKVLSKLRLLHATADASDFEAYRVLASKLFPELFVKVSEIRACDLGADLSTAVFLAERLARTWAAAGDAAADCRAERPDIYAPLCLSLRDGTVRQLLLAKSRLHARWAEASLRAYRGGTDAETARTLSEMKAARANDRLIAERVLETLRPLEGLLGSSDAGALRGGRLAATADGSDNPDEELDEALNVAGALLTWLPRGHVFYRLSAAQQAYADGLSWCRKARPSKLLVISAKSFAPDPLKALRLDAEQAAAAATANWKSAAKFKRLTEQSLSAAR